MTFVLTVNGPNTIWMSADRRLSAAGRLVVDDACKIAFLVAGTVSAILGYSGLGRTARGTQPSDWMSSVLRGQSGPLEHLLKLLADAVGREFPRHIGNLPHHIVVPAFVAERAQRYFVGTPVSDSKGTALTPGPFHFTRFVSPKGYPPRISMAGSGGAFLDGNRKWFGMQRTLLNLARAHESGRIGAHVVAGYLAEINHYVAKSIKDKSVGDRCIVAWRRRKGGGDHYFFTGVTREENSPALPTIAHGLDLRALGRLLDAHVNSEGFKGACSFSFEQALASIPKHPDEKLR